MEFPELGDHCAVATCSQLDFLPFTCDACGKTFCKDHREYEKHGCEEAYAKNVTVPVCPLCNQPVPTKRGSDPNVSVDEHIANDCQSDKAKKAYSNKCRYPGCKKKELVPVVCDGCGKNYCFRHRLGADHDCVTSTTASAMKSPNKTTSSTNSQVHKASNKTPQATYMSRSGAEMNRLRMERKQQQSQQQQQSRSTNYSQLQGMSEDEALAVAMAASLGQKGPPQSSLSNQSTIGASGYDEDEALARAVAASLQEEEKNQKRQSQRQQPRHQQQKRKSDNDTCAIS